MPKVFKQEGFYQLPISMPPLRTDRCFLSSGALFACLFLQHVNLLSKWFILHKALFQLCFINSETAMIRSSSSQRIWYATSPRWDQITKTVQLPVRLSSEVVRFLTALSIQWIWCSFSGMEAGEHFWKCNLLYLNICVSSPKPIFCEVMWCFSLLFSDFISLLNKTKLNSSARLQLHCCAVGFS